MVDTHKVDLERITSRGLGVLDLCGSKPLSCRGEELSFLSALEELDRHVAPLHEEHIDEAENDLDELGGARCVEGAVSSCGGCGI